MPDAGAQQAIEAVRRFSRFYTRKIGVLHEGLLGSAFSLTEARIIYELAHRENATATDLCRELALDPGYLSRILKGFEQRGLIARRAASDDARQSLIALTDLGQERFAVLNARSLQEVGAMIDPLSAKERTRLIGAIETIETLLGHDRPHRAPYILRPHQPGDIGWVIQQHGKLYAQEYGWDETFEAFVAEIAARFILEFDPQRERCWIAERDGETVGSAFVVRESDELAKLRMVLVHPSARGLGIGKRLVAECIAFARLKGYGKLTLWTNDILLAARGIYVQAGFRLIKEEPHHSFGKDLVGQYWELTL